MLKISDKKIRAQNRLLRQMPETACSFELGNYEVKILDIHFHLPNFRSSPWHSHSYFEAHLIFNGSGELLTYKGGRKFQAGELMITSPNFEHSWSTEDNALYMYVVSFELSLRKDAVKGNLPLDIVFSKLFEMEEFICPLDGIDGLIAKITSEISEAKPGLNYMLQSYARELVISFARQVNTSILKISELPHQQPGPQEDQIVVLINKYLADNYTNDISLDMIARFVAKSKRSITRHYKAMTGTTIIDKLLQMRLFLAEHLLANTDKPVKAVAYEVGLSDVSYFCRQFKKVFDCSPTKYRELNPAKHPYKYDGQPEEGFPIRFNALKP
jgi:AraC-like DNA-binding protein